MEPSPFLIDTTRSSHARLKPVPISAVRLEDEFWGPRLRRNLEVSLPDQYRQIVDTGRLANFYRAAGKGDGPFQGYFFNDSDVYKWLEGAAWALAGSRSSGDPTLANVGPLQDMVDTTISAIEGAQQPDGYLNTYFMFERASQRWTDLRVLHELYCAGHLFQAAIAHRRVTGSSRLLEVACRLADHIVNVFGPGKRPGACGHPEIEMALVELYRLTGERKYLDQAQIFLDNRGKGLLNGEVNLQDHLPFRQLDRQAGHAVRALYLSAGAADLFAETGEAALGATLERLWERMVSRQLYVTGGAGSRYEGEAFGDDWELPNARAYTETCAAIASLMWNARMLLLDGEARYADLLEWILYNAVLPGVSLDGLGYFYVNPLADGGGHRRQPWFGCACCPPNVARTLAAFPGYIYSLSGEGVWTHLYVGSDADLILPDGRSLSISQHSSYPWEGRVLLEVTSAPPGELSLFLRIPGWLEDGGSASLNGYPLDLPLAPGEYLEVRRPWATGDRLLLDFPMPVRFLESHPYTLENDGRVALSRGPILYCAEAAGNPELVADDLDFRDAALSTAEPVFAEFRAELLGGVVELTAPAHISRLDPAWEKALYRPAPSLSRTLARQGGALPFLHPTTHSTLRLVPYFAWANREPGQMQIWLKRIKALRHPGTLVPRRLGA